MIKKEALKKKIQLNRRNVHPDELKQLLLAYGFKLARITGDHYEFTHPGFRTQTIPRKNPVWIVIVNQVLVKIAEIEETE